MEISVGVEAMRDSIYIDLTPAQMKGLELDEIVTVIVTGKVKSLRAPEDHTKEQKARAKKDGYKLDTTGSMNVDIDKIDVQAGNEFTELAED